jgi:hypothetical protein
MCKYFFSIIFPFLVCIPVAVCAQTPTDTTVSIKDTVVVQTDSSASGPNSSETVSQGGADEINEDSIYLPVRDSAYLNAYALREVPHSKVDKYLADRDYEYANDPAYWEKDKLQNNQGPSSFWNFMRNKVIQWILFFGVIAVIVYGLFLLARENNFRWFSRRSEQPQHADPDSLLRGTINYDEAITKYQAEGNYRFAIRYLFLRLIHSVADKNIIQIRDSMTNAEIGRAFGHHPLAPQFRYLATVYEYIYFGDFILNKEIFDSLKMKFELFQEKISA